jgi:hypothetical protein
VNAYKFLEPDGRAPFTGFHWPVGEWVVAETLAPCSAGIHACRARDLPIWLGPELWEIELDGEIRELPRKLVARRGRLVRRLEGWSPGLLDGFATFCLDRTRRRVGSVPVLSGLVGDVARFRSERRIAIAGFAAARAAELRDGPRAYEEERAVQAAWLAGRLGLDPPR